MGELGDRPKLFGAADPIVRLKAVAGVYASLSPLKAAIENAASNLDSALDAALKAIEERRETLQAEVRATQAEQPGPGMSQLQLRSFEQGKKFRVGELQEQIEALNNDIVAAREKVAQQRAGVEAATQLFRDSEALLAEAYSQAS
jgi:uncharacterized small protein (DUF1192 family)